MKIKEFLEGNTLPLFLEAYTVDAFGVGCRQNQFVYMTLRDSLFRQIQELSILPWFKDMIESDELDMELRECNFTRLIAKLNNYFFEQEVDKVCEPVYRRFSIYQLDELKQFYRNWRRRPNVQISHIYTEIIQMFSDKVEFTLLWPYIQNKYPNLNVNCATSIFLALSSTRPKSILLEPFDLNRSLRDMCISIEYNEALTILLGHNPHLNKHIAQYQLKCFLQTIQNVDSMLVTPGTLMQYLLDMYEYIYIATSMISNDPKLQEADFDKIYKAWKKENPVAVKSKSLQLLTNKVVQHRLKIDPQYELREYQAALDGHHGGFLTQNTISAISADVFDERDDERDDERYADLNQKRKRLT